MGGPRRSKTSTQRTERVTREQTVEDIRKPDEREAFAQWLITPKLERVPLTMRALADELGVTEMTLTNWKRNKTFMRQVYVANGRNAKVEWERAILERQYEIAIGGSQRPSDSTAAAKLLLGIMKEVVELEDAVEDAVRPIEDMSLEELRAELGSIVDLIDDKIDLEI